MLVKRDAVAQKRFIPTSLVLLIDLAILEELDLVLHSGDLLVKVQDDVFVDGVSLPILLTALSKGLDLVSGLLQLGVTLEFLVDDRACVSLIDIVVA